MKKITGLNDRLEHFEDVPEGAEFLVPLVRQMVVKQLAMAQPRAEKPEDAIRIHDVASLVMRSPLDNLDLEDEDFQIVQEAAKQNRPGYIGFYQGQLLKRLRSWSEAEKK